MGAPVQYNISVPETYEKNGEEKTAWTNVGRAFANDGGSISLDLPKNVAVSGRVMLFPKDEDISEGSDN